MSDGVVSTESDDTFSLVATVAAVGAVAAGVIHLKAIGEHLAFPVVAIAFALIGAAQLSFAAAVLIRPSATVFMLGALLHTTIIVLWVFSRTTGFAFVPGAEDPSDIGVPDLVAQGFSIAIIGAAVIWMALRAESRGFDLAPAVVNRVKAVVLVGALFMTVPALFAPHEHSHEESSATDEGHGHDDESTSGTEAPGHGHEDPHSSTTRP